MVTAVTAVKGVCTCAHDAYAICIRREASSATVEGAAMPVKAVSADPMAWLPLHVGLGLPLIPPALCAEVRTVGAAQHAHEAQVCARAREARFLSDASRAAHESGQRGLQEVLRGLMQQHALCSPSLVGEGAEWGVEPPMMDLWFDGAQLVRRDVHKTFGGICVVDSW